MKLRAIAALAIASVFAVGLSACSSGGSQGKTTIEFATEQSTGTPLLKALQSAANDYEKAHPDVTIDVKTGGDDYESQMKVRLAAHNPPDLFETHGWSLLRYSPFLAPLQDEPWAKNFNKALAPAMKNSKGQFFALPVDTDVAGLVVNETVLAKAGVNADDITTWDDFLDAAAKVAATGAVPLPLTGPKQGSTGNFVDWAAPGAFTDAQLKDFKDGKFQSAEYQKVLDALNQFRTKSWINPDYSSATGDDTARALAENKAAFAFDRNSLITQAHQYAPDAKLQFIPLPAMNGSKQYLIGGEDVAFGAAKDGAHLDQAKDFLAYLAKPSVDAKLVAATGNSAGLTNVKADYGTLAASYQKWVEPGKIPLRPYFDRVYLPNGMWNTVVTTSDSVVAGQSSPQTATAKMASDFSTLYKKN